MTNNDIWTLIIGLILPPIIAVINQAHWSPTIKGIVALVVCGLVALGVEEVRGTPNWHDWRNTALLIAGAAIISYRQFWQPSLIAPTIEAKTTKGATVVRR
jgi:uncharacterized membrane protein YqaE (UPF0057 family)